MLHLAVTETTKSQSHPCPACEDAVLVDGSCPACGGKLIANGDLGDAACKALSAARLLVGAPKRPCPLCAATMTVVETRGVEVDRCDACELVWIDGSDGEGGEVEVGPPLHRFLGRGGTR